MPDSMAAETIKLEIISPDQTRRFVQVSESPFLIGRGNDTGNHLQLSDSAAMKSALDCGMTRYADDIFAVSVLQSRNSDTLCLTSKPSWRTLSR